MTLKAVTLEEGILHLKEMIKGFDDPKSEGTKAEREEAKQVAQKNIRDLQTELAQVRANEAAMQVLDKMNHKIEEKRRVYNGAMASKSLGDFKSDPVLLDVWAIEISLLEESRRALKLQIINQEISY